MVDNSPGDSVGERPESKPPPDGVLHDEAEQIPTFALKLKSVIRKNVDPSKSRSWIQLAVQAILVYGFDLLRDVFGSWLPQKIPRMILERNLYGLDIDERASQLAAR